MVHVASAAEEPARLLDALAKLAEVADDVPCIVVAAAGGAATAAEAFATRRALDGTPWSVVHVEGAADPLVRLGDFLPTVLAHPGEPSWAFRADTPSAAPMASTEEIGGDDEGEEDEVVALLAEIWGELLGVAPRPDDDFFLLGGHSLLATRLITRVRDLFGVEMRLRTLFQTRTVTRMARWIEGEIIARIDAMSEDEAASLV